MPSPLPLPAELRGRPFLLEEALSLGVTRRRLAGSRYRRILRRVYVSAEVPDSVELRCRAAALVMPAHMVFCGLTAARLYRIPVPPDDRTHVALPAGTAQRPQMEGIAVHRYGWRPDQLCEVGGLRVVRPEPLFLELARSLHRVDLVIAGDALLNKGWTRPQVLARTLAAERRRPGLRQARRVLPQLEPRSDSPMETRLRLIIIDAGFPRPVAGRDILDDQRVWIGRPDLCYPESKIAIDYEGGHHRTDARQFGHDLTRDGMFAVNGWIHLKYDARTVFRSPERIVADLRAAFCSRR